MKVSIIKVFNLISILFIVFMVSFFGYRLVHYYLLEQESLKVSSGFLYDKLLIKESITNKGKNIVKSGTNYYYKGLEVNNYISYSGHLWQVVSFNEDRTVKLILADNETSLAWGEGLSFNESYLNDWLNVQDEELTGIFYNNLKDAETYLVKTKTCLDIIEEIESATCDIVDENNYIGLLSISEYVIASGNNSYLNNGTYFWTSTIDSDGNPWYIFDEGGANVVSEDFSIYGIRPTITLNNATEVFFGNGTKASPYLFEDSAQTSLSDIVSGEYIKYSDYIWKAVSIEDEKVKVVMNDYLKEDNQALEQEVVYDFSKTRNLGYYLNNTFYDSLANKEYLVQGPWRVGTYTSKHDDYKVTYEDFVTSYVGLLSIGDPGLLDLNDVFVINKLEEDYTIYTINKGKVFVDEKGVYLKIRPSVYLDSSLLIIQGNGTLEYPYIIGSGL